MVTQRVLVTGATGGFGRVLVSALCDAGYDVIATGRNHSIGATLLGCTFIPMDLTDRTRDADGKLAPLLKGIDTVFHLAALSSPWGKRTAFERANILVTQRLIAEAEAANVRAFIFASTPSIYTDSKAQLDISETTPLPSRFVNDYAATKYAAEQLVLAHAGTMRTLALRPRAIVSPFDTALLPRLVRASERGRMPLPGRGDALIELTDARDVAAAFIAASKRAELLHGRVFNISGGAPRRFEDLAVHVFKKLDRHVRLVPLNARLVMMAGSVMEGIARILPGQPEPPLTRYSAMALGWSQTFDLKAVRTALDWQPQYSPEQAIDWALEAQPHA